MKKECLFSNCNETLASERENYDKQGSKVGTGNTTGHQVSHEAAPEITRMKAKIDRYAKKIIDREKFKKQQ